MSIPSLNGNQIEMRITKPEGDGPFPALIGVAGGDQSFAYMLDVTGALREMGIVAVGAVLLGYVDEMFFERPYEEV